MHSDESAEMDTDLLHQQLLTLDAENSKLRRELAIQEQKNKENAQHLVLLQEEIRHRQREHDRQNDLVTQMARMISVAVQDYRDSMADLRQESTARAQSGRLSGDIPITYSDVISEFSDDSD